MHAVFWVERNRNPGYLQYLSLEPRRTNRYAIPTLKESRGVPCMLQPKRLQTTKDWEASPLFAD